MGKLANVLKHEELACIKLEVAEFVSNMLKEYLKEIEENIGNGYLDENIEKSFYDSVWGTIEISIGEILILDSPLLQRLKKIKQLGLVDVLYSSANHTRFSHTLGVLQTADVMVDKIINQLAKKSQLIPSDVKFLVRLAAIFHDVGHMFCSHASERFFQSNERYTRFELVEKVRNRFKKNLGIKPSISEILSVLILSDELTKKLIILSSESDIQVRVYNRNVDDFVEKIGCFILGFPYSEQYLPFAQIISGQIDADKLDYLKRDSHFTGVPVAVDMSRVFQKIRIVESKKTYSMLNTSDSPTPDNIFKLGIAAAATNTLDQLIVSRMMMFENVYYHQKTLTAEETLRYAMQLLDKNTKGLMDSFGSILMMTDDIIISKNFEMSVKLIEKDYKIKDTAGFDCACRILHELSERKLFKRCVALTSNNLTDVGKYEKDFYKKVIENKLPNEQDEFVEKIKRETKKLKELFRNSNHNFSDTTEILLIISPSLGSLSLNSNLSIAEKNNRDRNMEFEADSWLKSRASRKKQNYIVSYSEDRYLVYIATEMVLLRDYGLLINDSSIYSYNDMKRIDELKEYLEKNTGYYKDFCMIISSHYTEGHAWEIKELVRNWKNYIVMSLDTGKDETIDESYLHMFIKQFYRFSDEIGEFDVFVTELLEMLRNMQIVSKNEIIRAFLNNFKKLQDDSLLDFEQTALCNIGNYQDSSSHMSYYINNVNEQLHTHFIVQNLCNCLKQMGVGDYKTIVFLEDAFCSGRQILSIFETYMGIPIEERQTQEEHVEELDNEKKEILKKCKLVFSFVYYNEKNVQFFKARMQEIGLNDVLIVAPNVFPDKYFADNLSEEKQVLKKYLEKAGECLIKTKAYDEHGKQRENWKDSRIEAARLGYEDAQQLIAFSWNTPTYTMTPLWMKSKQSDIMWFPLFPRIDK